MGGMHPMLEVFYKTYTPVTLFRWIADCSKHGDDTFKKDVRNIIEGNTAEDENIAEDSENAEPWEVGFHEKGGLCEQMIRYLFKLLKKR